MKGLKNIVFAISVIIFLYLIYRDVNISILYSSHEFGRYVILIPLLYGILFKIFIPNDIYKGPGLSIMLCVLSVRYFLYPILWVNDEYYIKNINIDQYIIPAILFMICEMVIIIITINKYSAKEPNTLYLTKVNNHFNLKNCILITIIYLAIYISFPDVFSNRHFILNSDYIISEKEELESGVLSVIIKWIEVLLILSLITIRYNSRYKHFLSCLIILLIPRMFYEGNSRLSIVSPLFASMFFLYKLFPNKKRYITIICSLMLLFSITLLTMVKQYNVNNLGQIEMQNSSSTLNAYFQGVENVSIALKTVDTYGNEISIQTIINDMFRNMPAISSLFADDNNSIHYFNKTIYGRRVEGGDQIPPTIGQSIWYFGYLFFGILTFIMVRFVLWSDKKFKTSSSLEFTWLYAWAGTVVGWAVPGSFQHLYMFLHYTFIPLSLMFTYKKILR